MIGRRAGIGTWLLCVLAFCAFGAQSAAANGTTAFTCVEKTAEAGFSDEHCDNVATGESVKFIHKEIKPKLLTAIAISNEKTAEETKGTAATVTRWNSVGGISVELECTKANGTGSLENKEVEKVMQAVGTSKIEYTGCTVARPEACKVKEPLVQNSNLTTYEGESEMGVELSPKEKGIFASITFEGEKCVIKGITFTPTGNAQGTLGGSPNGFGATLTFTEGMGSLSIGGKPVTLISTITLQTKAILGLPEDPIVFTTTEK